MPPKIEIELNLETGSIHSVHSIGDPMDTDVKDDTDSDRDQYAGSDGSIDSESMDQVTDEPTYPTIKERNINLTDYGIYCVACTHELYVGTAGLEWIPHTSQRVPNIFAAAEQVKDVWDVKYVKYDFMCNHCNFDLGRVTVKGDKVELFPSQIMHKKPDNEYCTFIDDKRHAVCVKCHIKDEAPCWGPRGTKMGGSWKYCSDVHLCLDSFAMLGHQLSVDLPLGVNLFIIGGSWVLPEEIIYKYVYI